MVWLAELLHEMGFDGTRPTPGRQSKAIASARLKNDVDARTLAQLLRVDLWRGVDLARVRSGSCGCYCATCRAAPAANHIECPGAGGARQQWDRGRRGPVGWTGTAIAEKLELPNVEREIVGDVCALLPVVQTGARNNEFGSSTSAIGP